MDKETIKRFIAWLESASPDELRQKRKDIREAGLQVETDEGRDGIKLASRLLDEEIVSRLAVRQATGSRV